MGLTFYYSGTFNKNASLPRMIEEVKDIAEVNNWKYHIFEREFPRPERDAKKFDGKLYGISFSPPESEPVWLCFLSNGRISGPHLLQIYGGHQNHREEKKSIQIQIVRHKIDLNYAEESKILLIKMVFSPLSKKRYARNEYY